jgi:hypothetical protein
LLQRKALLPDGRIGRRTVAWEDADSGLEAGGKHIDKVNLLHGPLQSNRRACALG